MASPDVTSAALDSVLARFAPLVRALGCRAGFSESDHDELLQDVRIRLWRALPSDRIGASPVSYVFRTARTAALDLVRYGNARGRGADELLTRAAAAPGPDLTCEARELVAIIEEAVRSLREPRRRAVRLRLLGYPSAEIATTQGWSGPKTRKLVSRGLTDLRAELRRRGVGPDGMR